MATWIALAVVFLSVSQTVSTSLKPPAVKPVRRFTARAGLPPSYAGPALARRLYSGESAAAGTSAVLILGALAVGLAVPALRDDGSWAVSIVAAYLLGRTVGAVVPVVKATVARDDDGPRVARPFMPTVADYVSPLARWAALASGLLPAACVGLIALFLDTGLVDASQADWPLMATGAAVGPVVTVGASVLAARFTAAPRRAAAPHELAADDAVRAYRIRALLAAATAVSALAATAVAGTATALPTGTTAQNPAAVLFMGAALATGLVYVGASLAVDLIGTGRRYRERLWPQGPPQGPAPDGGAR
ncbi:hypothetical protein O4J56_13190 [Nocardiopsis sp. RSe5-2]|uniref:Uncharacterized protein n=1 Tax=Nocardiopsis endophytica TaxID=3018445 RepID=A0ABT4U3T2_9ACTN|nr:hypothetical protein [Nocardiopsis endophytica]MDA2811590.1 hypothetical protein [Nocardiopsis endophytica]